MTVVEFGTRADANAVRDDHADHLTGRFDRRYSKVELVDDVPDDIEAQIRGIAADGRADREGGAGHIELTDGEKRRVGPFTGSNNYRKATAVKAAFLDAGIDDWEAYYDPEITADENTGRIEQIRQQQTGADGLGRFGVVADEGRERPSEKHRRAQNRGYVRSGSRGFDDDASARDGLGQFAATGGEETLDNFEETDA